MSFESQTKSHGASHENSFCLVLCMFYFTIVCTYMGAALSGNKADHEGDGLFFQKQNIDICPRFLR